MEIKISDNKKEPFLHGSDKIIKVPEYGKGAINNDYGQGFYCTENKGLAGEWAVSKTKKNGYINEYSYDFSGLKILNLDKLPIEIWIAILMDNRRGKHSRNVVRRKEQFVEKFLIDISAYDIIRGYRANDSFFTFVEDFMNEDITKEELMKAMKLGDMGIQICLKSPKSFEFIKWETAYQAQADRFYPLCLARDKKARDDYQKLLNLPESGVIKVSDMLRGDYNAGL
jgi:hypothetical protein